LLYRESVRGCLVLVVCGCLGEKPAPPDLARPRAPIGHLDAQPLYADADGGAALADGAVVARRSAAGWTPCIPPAGRIALDDGAHFVALTFATDGAPTARWIAPAHGRDEIAARERELAEEAARLPPSLQPRVREALPVLALISTLEGSFGDPATRRDDTAASLGIFQWAAPRNDTHAGGSTLSRFFVALSRRAADGREPLFVAAWQEAQAAGLSLRGGELQLDRGRKRARGGDVERRLAAAMGTGALRSYQLVAAVDWIDEVRGDVVRPGLRGLPLVGHAYAEAEGGRMVTLRLGDHTLELRARAPATVGDYLHGEALATAVSLGVNRPHFVETALWRARMGAADRSAEVERLLAAALAPLAAAAPSRERFGAGDVERAGAAVKEAARALAELVWPRPARVEPRAFVEEALALYRPGERERRARRLATER
jgi:hypothetical protein